MIPQQQEKEEEDISGAKSDHDPDDETNDEPLKAEAEVAVFSEEHLAKIYVFALVWSIGAFLDTEDRLKYDIYLKETYKTLDLPVNTKKCPDVSKKCSTCKLHNLIRYFFIGN